MTKKIDQGLRYVGGGSFIPGVPARDLTAEEAAEHRARIEEQQTLTGLRLYETLPAAPVVAEQREG